MPLTAPPATLDLLHDAGIISAGHRRRALADTRAADLAELPDPAHQLAWLVCRDIVTMEDLQCAFAHVAGAYTGAEQEGYNNIMVAALEILDHMRLEANRETLGALRSADLITESEHELLLPKLPSDLLLHSAARAFVWIKHSGHLGGARINAIRYARRDGDDRRNAILDEVEEVLGEQRAAISTFWDQVLPGPRWLWIAAQAPASPTRAMKTRTRSRSRRPVTATSSSA